MSHRGQTKGAALAERSMQLHLQQRCLNQGETASSQQAAASAAHLKLQPPLVGADEAAHCAARDAAASHTRRPLGEAHLQQLGSADHGCGMVRRAVDTPQF